MYHGSRNETIEFFPAICLTSSRDSAESYGDYLHEVEVDESQLTVLVVEMTDAELREAIDSQEWPCDRDSEIESAIASGHDAVSYRDVDEDGTMHDCIRILTADAWTRACRINCC